MVKSVIAMTTPTLTETKTRTAAAKMTLTVVAVPMEMAVIVKVMEMTVAMLTSMIVEQTTKKRFSDCQINLHYHKLFSQNKVEWRINLMTAPILQDFL